MKDKKILNIPVFTLILVLICVIGGFLRFYQLASIPPGVQQDEASAAYEGYSLLVNGTDRWGNKLPVYFPSWGSGQNVLESYLLIPVIAVGGLTVQTIRFVPAILGTLALPLFYLTLKNGFRSRKVAVTGLLLLTFMPWGIMSSRFALESNILPFFILLSFYLISRLVVSYQNGKKLSPGQIAVSLIPLALALYAYGIVLLILPGLALIGLFSYRKLIRKNWRAWLVAGLVFLAIATPIFLFTANNYLIKQKNFLPSNLPITIPLLPVTRLEQISEPKLISLFNNGKFFVSGFNDHLIFNTDFPFMPLTVLCFPLLIIGLFTIFKDIKENFAKKKLNELNLFLVWMVACSPMLIMPMNVNRFNTVIFPVIAIMAYGLVSVIKMIKRQSFQKALIVLLVLFFVGYDGFFVIDYFSTYTGKSSIAYNAGLDKALAETAKIAGSQRQVYFSETVTLNYVYFLFFNRTNPRDFYQNMDADLTGGVNIVWKYQNYSFVKRRILAELNEGKIARKDLVLLLKTPDNPSEFCDNFEVTWHNDIWLVGKCQS